MNFIIIFYKNKSILTSGLSKKEKILYNIFRIKRFKKLLKFKSFKKSKLEQVSGIEPPSQPWQGRILTVVLHLHV